MSGEAELLAAKTDGARDRSRASPDVTHSSQSQTALGARLLEGRQQFVKAGKESRQHPKGVLKPLLRSLPQVQ